MFSSPLYDSWCSAIPVRACVCVCVHFPNNLLFSPSESPAIRSSATAVEPATRPTTSTFPLSSNIFTNFHIIDFVCALRHTVKPAENSLSGFKEEFISIKSALDSHVKIWMQLERNTYLNAHAMSIHITFSHKKPAMKVNWIMNAARRTQSFR